MNRQLRPLRGRKEAASDEKIAGGEAQFYLGLEAKRQRLLAWLQRLRAELQAEASQQNGGPER
ncbi:MAG: hypothetical protein M3Z04_25440 [Chloroflexota bacterium]|nr:hypothetical protein [Chloroflexota bacterium]